nr:MAG TPA: Putative head tail adaptor [Caudoviricetes sp.]
MMSLIPTQRLDRKISIQHKTTHKNEYYEWVTDWETKATVWCSVKQQYFKDYKEALGTVLEDTTNFIIRYEQQIHIDNSMRVVYNGVNYDIIQVLEGSFQRDFTTLVCKRVKE